MTVTATLKGSASGSSGSTVSTSSFTTTAGKYYLFVVRNGVASGYPTSVSCSAGTISFSTINSATNGANAVRVYGGYCTAGGTGTFTSNQSSSNSMVLAGIEISGMTATGAVVQSTNATGTSTSPSSTLAAFGDANNATFMVITSTTNPTITAENGFSTVYYPGSPGTPSGHFINPGNDTTPSATLSSSVAWATVSLEIKNLRTDTYTRYPTSTSTTGGSTAWSNTGNIYLSDNTYATVDPDVTASNNTYLDVKGFNFTYPSTATIIRATCDIEAKYTGSGIPTIESIQLLKAGSTAGTTYTPGTALTTSDLFYTPTTDDLWGTTISYTDANNSGFGVRLRFKQGLVQNDTGGSPNGFAGTITSSGGSISWSNTSNAGAVDASYASQTAPSSTASSNDYLKFSNFGFSVPSNATIVGIWAYFGKRRANGSAGNIRTNTFQLTKAGSLVGTNNADTGTNWPISVTDEAVDSGIGNPQLWGTTWTYSDVNDSGFGMWIRPVQVDPSTSTSATFSTSAADQANASIAWTNPSNANASDSTYATQTAPGSSANTAANYNYLYLTGYGFSIPSNATIKGVTASIRRLRNGGSTGEMRFNTVQLLKGGTPTGTNLATATNFPTTVAAVSFGGTTNMWGNSLTYSDVNASNFGLAIRLVGSTSGTNRVGNIDSASLTITYTTPGDRDAQIDYGQMGVYYSTPGTSTIQLDTVRLNLSATGSVNVGSSISETTSQTVTRFGRTRNISSSISETLALAADITVTQPYKFFDFSITESESLIQSLSRLRKINFSNAETEALTVAMLKRSKKVASTISESETVSATRIKRLRKVTLSIVEADALAISIDRVRKLSATVAEVEALTFALMKIKGMSVSIAEVEAFAADIIRARKNVVSIAEVIANTFDVERERELIPTISEVETVSPNFKRARKVNTTITETETITTALSRLKKVAFSLAEAFDYTFDISKFKALAFSIAETDTFSFGALRRVRKVNSTISEVLSYAENLSRNRGFEFTAAQVETINASIDRLLEVTTIINETYGSTDKLSRKRNVNTTINEIEALSVAKLARLKLLAYVCSETSNHSFWMSRARRFNPITVAETESIIVNLNRARALTSSINENESLTFDFGRLRKQIFTINETQGTTAALSRLREVLTSIAQATDYQFDLRVIVGDPAVVNVTITYRTWVNVSTNTNNSVFDLDTKTETMSFTNKTNSTSDFTWQTTSVSDFIKETALTLDIPSSELTVDLDEGSF